MSKNFLIYLFVFSHFRTFSDNLKLKKINSDVFRFFPSSKNQFRRFSLFSEFKKSIPTFFAFFRVQKINSDVFRFFSEFKKSIPTFFAFFRVQKINSEVSHFSELKKSISGRLITFYPIIWSSGCFSSGHLFIWSNTFPPFAK